MLNFATCRGKSTSLQNKNGSRPRRLLMESLENREMMSANSIQSIDEQPVYEPTAMIAPPVIQASAQNENVPFIAAALPTVDYDFGTVTTAKTRTDTYNREHWYKFTVSDWTTVTLEGLTQDHRLEIYAADGTTRLTYNMNSGTHYKSVSLGTTGETRTFYARVYYDSDTVNNSDTYTLRIEPTVNLGTVTATKNQTDTYKGGDRWYKFTVSDITTVTLEGLMQDHRLEIYAADGTTRLTYNMNSGTHYKSASLGTTGETRTFYARVYYDSDYVNNNDTFTLRIEPTVNLGTVTAVLPRTDTYKGGERWYKFTVSSGATVTLEGLAQDHRLEIYASNGTTRVGYNMNSGTSNKSVSLGTAGTYYAVVYYDSDYVNNNDTYTLRITPTVPAAPVVTVTNQAGSVKLTWGTISGADRYEILRQNSNGSWTTLGYTTALQYVDSSVTVNVATSYIVRACKGSAVSTFTIVYGRAQLGVPQVAVTNQSGSVKLTWGTISGVDRYEILRQNSNGSWTTLGYTTALQYVDSSVAVNVATSYIVRACKGSAVSAFTIVYGKALPKNTSAASFFALSEAEIDELFLQPIV